MSRRLGRRAEGAPGSVGWTEPQRTILATADTPFVLEGGAKLGPLEVEFETYGRLAPAGDNAILVCHALSGDAHVAGWDRQAESKARHYRKGKPGWWDDIVGPGKALDTSQFFVICPNILGSCYGTTGPSSTNPATGRPFGLAFPIVTIHDWVRLQARLLDCLGIRRLRAVTGGSLGGQQAIEWALAYPERVERCIILAASPRLSAQGLAFNAVGRYAIMNDPNFAGGDYYGHTPPATGLAAARMLAHITYLSDEGLHEKFGRKLKAQDPARVLNGFDPAFEVESYLHYQGRIFVERFDANSYLYISRAMDLYDAAKTWGGGDLVEASRRITAKILVVSFSSDWLYPPSQCQSFALALTRAGKTVTYVNLPSKCGHDAFLVETGPVGRLLRHFVKRRE